MLEIACSLLLILPLTDQFAGCRTLLDGLIVFHSMPIQSQIGDLAIVVVVAKCIRKIANKSGPMSPPRLKSRKQAVAKIRRR